MTERFQQAKQLVLAALELPSEKQPAYLDEACGVDEALRTEVESLLGADTARIAFVDSPPLRLLPEGTDSNEPKIGAYRIVRELGRGGMGVVYLAERTDEEFEHQVAIKVVKRGMDAAEITARFRRERQILANLNHPNIACLFEGGRTADGRLYFLLEYVEGEPIDAYCKRQDLSVEERLHLFLKVCAAVEHAHRNLVVHRDLKPRNILVTLDGQPKLLDFGIAKLLQVEVEAAVSVTAPPWRFLTLDYASPEQLRGDAITTACDVYSLGVLLYQLLAGTKPYELAERSEPEVYQTISEATPEKPSAAVRSRDTATRTAGTTRSLSRRLAGDLDTIVLKALRKEPERRYGSVAEFAEDIRRHLDGLPVQAQQDTWVYRTGKFVRRNRAVLLPTASIFLLTLGFAIAMALEVRAKETQRERAELVSEFLVRIFSASDPTQHPGEQITARDLLEAAEQRLVDELGDQPLLQADLFHTISRSYAELGMFEAALSTQHQTLRIRQKILGDENPDTVRSLNYVGLALYNLGRYDEARRWLDEAAATSRHLGDPEGLATSHNHLGLVAASQARFEDATIHYEEALRLREALFGKRSAKVAESLYNLSQVLKRQQKYEDALPIVKRSLDLDRSIHGNLHPNVLIGLNGVSVLLRKLGRYDEADQYFRQAVDLARKLYPGGHPYVAATLNNYALLLVDRHDFPGAERLYREALDLENRFRGPDHPDFANALINLAVALRYQDRLKEAEPLYRQAVGILLSLFGPDHPEVLRAEANLAELLWESGRREEGTALQAQVAEKRRKILPPDSPIIATDLHNLAFYREIEGRYKEAEALCRDALRRDRAVFVADHPDVVRDTHRLSSILWEVGDYEECEEYAREALEKLSKLLPIDHWRLDESRSVLGGCLAGQGRISEARDLLELSLHNLAESRGAEAWQYRAAQRRAALLE